MSARVTEWRAAPDDVRTQAPQDGGLRLELGPGADLGRLTRLIAAEWQCCFFLTFVLTVDDRGAGWRCGHGPAPRSWSPHS